jgi:hypothetical protein
MAPSGGFMVPALERLGFKPYCFTNVYQRGNASLHPPEWAAVIEGKKKFDAKILDNKFDCLVGPPAAIAFDRILKECPAFTKVVLVEEADKEQWARDYDQYVVPLLHMTKKTSKRSIGMHFHNMIANMFPDDKKLGRIAALEIYEERVKRVIPRDSLLVFRHGDGWEPLAKFLGKDVPNAEEVTFPPLDNPFECCGHLEDRIKRAESMTMYATVFLICASLVAFWPVVRSMSSAFGEYYRDYQLAFNNEIGSLQQEGKEKDMSVRKAMILSKQVTMDFEEKWRDKGITLSIGGGAEKATTK